MTATGFTEGGTGWYRKTFKLDKTFAGKQTIIQFEGVYMDADVWINGHHLGNHPYGYTSFMYNLSRFLNKNSKPNVLAVRVRNEGKNSRWYTGSGIYRHVWLIPVAPVHTKIWGNYITTSQATKDKAVVMVKTAVENTTSLQKTIGIKVDLLNPAGLIVATKMQSVTIMADSSAEAVQQLTLSHPKLWAIDNPVLYKARVTLTAGNKVIDQTITPVGIRTLKFDAQKGLLINGQSVKLKGDVSITTLAH
jgi:beta-galactosidase